MCKPSHLIDSLHIVRKLVPKMFSPKMGFDGLVDSLREYTLREVPQGPSVALTRNTRNGGRFETRVVAGYIPVGPGSDHKRCVEDAAAKLSDCLRSKLFSKVFLDVVQQSQKDNGTPEPGRHGIYGIIKDPHYFLWDALKTHRLEVSHDCPLNCIFLDSTVDEMLSRMFPDDPLDDDVRDVGYKEQSDAEIGTGNN